MKCDRFPLRALRLLSLLGTITGATGCIKPDLVIVDRKTALEEQAAGSFSGLSDELDRAGVVQGAVPFTRGELEQAGVRSGRGDEALGRNEAASDAELLDELLLRRCVGEALDGTLVDTPGTCTAPIEPARQSSLVERANRRRFQIWRYLQGRQPGRTLEEVRREWRKVHLFSAVCGAQVQVEGGAWEVKRCS